MTQDTLTKNYCLPVLLWLGAFVCALYPVNTYQLELFMASLVLLFGWTAIMLFRKVDTGWNMPRSWVLRLAGFFWVLVLASVFWSEIKPISIIAVCFFSFMPLTFYGGIMGGADNYFAKLVKPLAVLFAVLSLWAVFQYFFLNQYFMHQARHPLADPSSLGSLFSLMLFASMGWMVSSRPLVERRLALTLSALLLCGILSTIARGPIFAFVPGILLFVIFLWPQVKAAKFYFLILGVVCVGYYGLMQTNLAGGYDIGGRIAQTIAAPAGEATQNRVAVWTSTIEMIKDRPLLGTGIGTFFLYYPEYRLPQEIDGVFLAHNDPMQFWVELGVLGPLLFYAFVFAAAGRSFSALKRLPADGNGNYDRIIIVTVLAALTSMIAGSHVGFNLYNLSILLLAGLFLSVWFNATRRALPDEKTVLIAMPDNMPHNLNKALIVLPFIMMGWLFLGVTGGEHMTNKARDALFKQDMDRFLVYINKADQVSMRLNSRAFLLAVNVPMAILEDRKSTLNEGQQKKLYEQVLWYMHDVLAINPRTSSAYFYLAKVQSLVAPSVIPEGTETPRALYEKALRLDPAHLGARLELLRIYEDEGMSLEDRIAFMEAGREFTYNTPKVTEYYTTLSTLYLENSDYENVELMVKYLKRFKARSDFSLLRQNTSIPQAIIGGDEVFPQP